MTQEPHRNRDSKSSAAHCFCHAKYTHVSQTLWRGLQRPHRARGATMPAGGRRSPPGLTRPEQPAPTVGSPRVSSTRSDRGSRPTARSVRRWSGGSPGSGSRRLPWVPPSPETRPPRNDTRPRPHAHCSSEFGSPSPYLLPSDRGLREDYATPVRSLLSPRPARPPDSTCASYTPFRARHREGDGDLALPGAKNLDPAPLVRTCVRDYSAGRVYADPRIH